jgi:PAS domain S-box-containing protein
MSKFPIPKNEKKRLKALNDYQIVNSLREKEFDRITELATLICDVPISLVSLIDEHRQWIKSAKGLDIHETSRDFSFCQYAIMDNQIFEVENALQDDRFKKNPLVTGNPNIRFYAGYPLVDPDGYALGTLCVIDNNPNKLTEKQRKALQLLADGVISLIVERRQKVELENFEKIFTESNDLICVAGIDGLFKKVNPAFHSVLGWDTDFLLKTSYFDLIHPDDVAITQKEVEKLASGHSTIDFKHRFKTSSNQYKTIQWSVVPETSTGNLFAVGRDISKDKENERQLLISEHKLKAFFESSQGFMNTFDMQGNFLSLNDAYANSLGYTKEELFKVGIKAVMSEEGGQDRIDAYFSALKKRKKMKGEAVVRHKNGAMMMWAFSSILVESPIEEPYVISNALDITDRYAIEIELRRTKGMLEQTNNIARIGGWEYDIEKQKLHWTSVTKEIVGVAPDYEPEIFRDTHFFKEGESRDKVTEAIGLAIAEGKSMDLELQLVNQQGKEVWVRMLANAETENGICKKLYGALQDIDEKKKVALEVAQAKKLLDDVLRSATEVCILALDTNYIVTLFNSGAEKLLGYATEEMLGKLPPVALTLPEEVAKRREELSAEYGYPVEGFRAFVHKAEMEGSEKHEWTFVRKDGSTLIVEFLITTIRDENGTITGYLGMAIDISDLKKAKENVEILADQLQKQNDKLLNFAHITSHNLRSPVSNLNSLLHFYKESPSQEDKEMLFTKFETVINHLTSTLNELIEVLKIQEDVSKVRETVFFENIFTKTQEILTGNIMETHAIVTGNFSKAESIEYPKTYLESIMLNLLSNAMKYKSPDRAPEIHFQTEVINGQIILTASDNGLGIDLKKHGHKLFGLNKTFHKHAEAKGVGLFITKTQIEAMGGTISAQSEVGKGTTFTIVFDTGNNV